MGTTVIAFYTKLYVATKLFQKKLDTFKRVSNNFILTDFLTTKLEQKY